MRTHRINKHLFFYLFHFLSELFISASPRIPWKDASAHSSNSAQVGKLVEVWRQGLSSLPCRWDFLVLFWVVGFLWSFAFFTHHSTGASGLREAGDSTY